MSSILEEGERLGKNRVSSYEVQDFLNYCVDLGLADINYSGSRYTWSNGHVWSKIDRAMCNQQWLSDGLGGIHSSWELSNSLCWKLKTLKGPLKELNKKDYSNAKKNFIASLTKRDGFFTTSKEEIQEEFVSFYVRKVVDYGLLLDKVAKTLLVWSGLNLSYAWKLEAISSVV
ncbi:hypothetical protein M9H77_09312 [Catharanthus roseus]|uniref:Uncharacterized protein n=1 Tax=Catharanthus roseus TaxID=4058 RepID=A0ACC0C0G3_CATRO|nr:hypothetical protein M9H77_09312 [Catharanthus roseus]